MSTITLNEDEQRCVRFLAQRTFEECRKRGALATVYGLADPIKREVESLGAEFAYCKLFNLWPPTVADRPEFFDARLRNGDTVDVKHTDRPRGRLLVKVKNRKNLPVYYALMIGKFPTYSFVQHCLASEVLVEERIDRTLNHPAYSVEQGECVARVEDQDVVENEPPTQLPLWK